MRVVDTNVAVDHLRGDERATRLLERLLDEGEVLVASELTRFEILAGLRREETEATERFMAVLDWVGVDENIARVAGSLASMHRAAHSGISPVDYVIAATSILIGAEVLTTNVRHFPMISDLRPAYE